MWIIEIYEGLACGKVEWDKDYFNYTLPIDWSSNKFPVPVNVDMSSYVCDKLRLLRTMDLSVVYSWTILANNTLSKRSLPTHKGYLVPLLLSLKKGSVVYPEKLPRKITCVCYRYSIPLQKSVWTKTLTLCTSCSQVNAHLNELNDKEIVFSWESKV